MTRAAVRLAVAALLLVGAALAVSGARHDTPTVDEYAHLPAGCALLRHGTFWHYGHNPPLAKAVMALPVVLSGAVVPEPERLGANEWAPWIYGDRFLAANRERYFALFFRARLAAIAIWLTGGVLLFALAASLFGDGAALLALFLWVFCPNLAAHGRLVTLDVPVTVAILAALLALERATARPAAWRFALAGLLLGAAMLTKFTAILLVPVTAVLLALGDSPPGRRARAWLLRAALVFGAALLAVNAGYLFRGSFARLDTLPLASEAGLRVKAALPSALPIPLPRDLVLGLDAEKRITERGEFGTYLAGTWWPSAPAHYELLALALKLPLATLLLAALAFTLARPRSFLTRRAAFVLLPPLAILAGLSLLSALKTGVRYVLPAVPFLFLAIAAALPRLPLRSWRAAAAALFAASLVVSTVRIHPHELSFFSALAGGAKGGPDWLLDSNVDWGQDLSEVPRWLEDHRVEGVRLLYFGHVDPGLYGIDYELPPPAEAPGTYLVSVNYAKGASYVAPDHGRMVRVSGGAPAWLRSRVPDETIGTSILVYRVGAR